MDQMLQKCIAELQELPETTQQQVAMMLSEALAALKDADRLDHALADAAYRAAVEASITAAEADVAAGRLFTAEEVRARSAARLKALHDDL